MKVLAPALGGLLLILPLHASAFEGTISFQQHWSGASRTLLYQIQGKKTHLSLGTDKNSLVLDFGAEKQLLLMPAAKMAIRSSLPKPLAEAASLSPTGQSKEIAGQACAEYAVSGMPDLHLWAAKGLGLFFSPSNGSLALLGSGSEGWELALRKQGLFPLRIENSLLGQKNVMEASKLSAQALDAKSFEAPSDFKVMEAENMAPAPKQESMQEINEMKEKQLGRKLELPGPNTPPPPTPDPASFKKN
jgi:hypothetical protein